MWDIYDDLIDSIPDNLTVQDCMLGLHWTLVKSEGGTGTAMTVNDGQEIVMNIENLLVCH